MQVAHADSCQNRRSMERVQTLAINRHNRRSIRSSVRTVATKAGSKICYPPKLSLAGQPVCSKETCSSGLEHYLGGALSPSCIMWLRPLAEKIPRGNGEKAFGKTVKRVGGVHLSMRFSRDPPPMSISCCRTQMFCYRRLNCYINKRANMFRTSGLKLEVDVSKSIYQTKPPKQPKPAITNV